MKNYIQPGDVLKLTAPAGGVVSGGGYQIGQLFVVAVADAVAGADFEGQTVGVFELTKNAPEVWSEGDLLYLDSSTSEVTTVAASNLLIGTASANALSADVLGKVRLNGAPRPTHFVSAEQTGTGAAQNIAHGLGVVPSAVFTAPTDTAPVTVGIYTVTEGAHDATNVIVTVTTGKKFKVLAWA